jgi:hypothetical protein
MRESDLYPWTNVPAYSWTDTQIEFEIPCGTFTKGNYKVRVQTSCGNSNQVVFVLKDSCCLGPWVSPDSGPCGTWLTLFGSGFTGSQNTAPNASGDGIVRFVKLVASHGEYFVKKYRNWTDTHIEVRFYNLWEDTDGDFVGDAEIKRCGGSLDPWPGPYQLYFVSLYYNDSDSNGDYTAGDTIQQVTISDPVPFELTPDPVVFRLNAREIPNRTRLKVRGQNFGDLQGAGEIRIGTKSAAQEPTLGRGKLLDKNVIWSNTVLKVKLKVPTKWQGKTKYVWVEKDGKKSNYKRIKILPVAP